MFPISSEDYEANRVIVKAFMIGEIGSKTLGLLTRECMREVQIFHIDANDSPITSKWPVNPIILSGIDQAALPNSVSKLLDQNLVNLRASITNSDLVFLVLDGVVPWHLATALHLTKLAKEASTLVIVGIAISPNTDALKESFQFQELIANADTTLPLVAEHLGSSDESNREHENKTLTADRLVLMLETLTGLITEYGLIGFDFGDLRYLTYRKGLAGLGHGVANGTDRSLRALEYALADPCLNGNQLESARDLLVALTVDHDFSFKEFDDVQEQIDKKVSDGTITAYAISICPQWKDKLEITILLYGSLNVPGSIS